MYGGTVENCTITANQAALEGGGIYHNRGGAMLNSILSANTAPEGPDTLSDGTGSSSAFTCSGTLLPGPGNLAASPDFVDATAGDYRLLPGSPCVDSGTSQDWMASGTDLDDLPRVVGGTVDMGAYELTPGPLLCNVVADIRQGFPGLLVTFRAFTSGANTTGLYYRWDLNGDGTIDSEGFGQSSVAHVFDDNAHLVFLSVSNQVGEVAVADKQGLVRIGPPLVYVSPAGAAVFPYINWTTAATSIHDAVAAGVDGTTVLVGDAVYPVATPIVLENAMTVRGANGAAGAIVDGAGGTRCFLLAHHARLARGINHSKRVRRPRRRRILPGPRQTGQLRFPREHRHGRWRRGIFPAGSPIASSSPTTATTEAASMPPRPSSSIRPSRETSAAGAACTTPPIRSSRTACSPQTPGAITGGGAYLSGGGTVRDSVFTENEAVSGGGLYAIGSSAERCRFQANVSSRDGGGLYALRSVVQECTVSGCSATEEGGGIYAQNSTVYGCLVDGNHAGSSGGGIAARQNAQVENCRITGNTGVGSIQLTARCCAIASSAATSSAMGAVCITTTD